MQFVRKVLLVLFAAFFPALLVAAASYFGLLKVVGSPEPVKKILSESGIYSTVVNSTLEQAKSTSENGAVVSLIDPAVKQAAVDAFSPRVVQDSSEDVIDGIYHWLDGKTTQPDFRVDLTNAKATFAEKVGQAAEAKAATLPVCTTVPTTTSAITDPFSATCLPRGLTAAQVGQQARDAVLTSQEFLNNPVITAESIKGTDPNKTAFEDKYQDAPRWYQNFKKAPIILAILTILAALAIIFLSPTRRAGARRVGITLALAGAFMLITAWIFNKAADRIIPTITLDNTVLQTSVHKLATDLTHSVTQNYWVFGGAYLALGILAVALTMFIGKNKVQTAAHPSSSPKPAAKPKENPKPKSPPKVMG